MTANNRLLMSVAMIIVSSGYAILVAKDPGTASAISMGYIAFLFTIFVLINVRKRP